MEHEELFDAVIFDWDGTLADTHQSVVNSFQKAFKTIGCLVDDEFVLRRIGIGARNTFKAALKETGRSIDEEVISRLVEVKIETQLEQTANITLFDGAYDLLSSLMGLLRIALASMNNRSVMDKLLTEKNVRGFFDVVLTADDVTNTKPHPEIFLKCAEALNLRPEKCVILEDSLFGVQAAKQAGMKCIVVPTGAFGKAELEKLNPDLTVNSLSEKSRILNFIRVRAQT